MWVDSRERLPENDGQFIYQSVYGSVSTINYTVQGGWNTHWVNPDELSEEYKIENDGYVARWFDVPEPEAIPEEWVAEYGEDGEDFTDVSDDDVELVMLHFTEV